LSAKTKTAEKKRIKHEIRVLGDRKCYYYFRQLCFNDNLLQDRNKMEALEVLLRTIYLFCGFFKVILDFSCYCLRFSGGKVDKHSQAAVGAGKNIAHFIMP
jgi:hypothetical protein